MKKISVLLISVSLLISFNLKSENKSKIEIITSETYELANIILALTEYGRSDPYEVQKESEYYKKVLSYFGKYLSDSLLKEVNYSREKWDEYLSFRTDAFAFSFDESGIIKRDYEFYSIENVRSFDKNIKLINEFAKKTNFRSFYESNLEYYKMVCNEYSKYYMIDEMVDFFESEFGQTTKNEYRIILSPLVGRMNCHRYLNENSEADFPSVAKFILNYTPETIVSTEDKATEIHTLFTEMAHGYVNPISENYNKEINKKFKYKTWQKESGYYSHFATFNEYMTWGVYDIFVKKYFPELFDKVTTNWHFQNISRGFIASQFFATKLISLYEEGKGEIKIKDYYLSLLDWSFEVRKQIIQPVIKNPKDYFAYYSDSFSNYTIEFNVPMKELKEINAILYLKKNDKYHKELIIPLKNINWSDNGKKMTFDVDILVEDEPKIVFNWWGNCTPLKSGNGILLDSYSNVKLKK